MIDIYKAITDAKKDLDWIYEEMTKKKDCIEIWYDGELNDYGAEMYFDSIDDELTDKLVEVLSEYWGVDSESLSVAVDGRVL